MNMYVVMVTVAASLLGGSAALAQVGSMGTSPLGATSPLATGSGAPVGPVGIPLGATEMATPGISPALPSTGVCSTGGPTSQTATTTLFDGGGMAGATSSGCAGAASAAPSTPAPSMSQVGRAGIPMGSTEMGDPGTSPAPPVTTPFVSPIAPSTVAPLSTMGSPSMTATPPCPVTGTFPDGSTTRQVRSGGSMGTGVPGC
jgi:hypothetical protein